MTGSSHLLIWLVMIKCQFFLVVNDSTFVYTAGYEFYPLYGSLLTLLEVTKTANIPLTSIMIHLPFIKLSSCDCSFLMFLLGPRKTRT